MTRAELARAVEVAMPSLVVSLASWGVRSGHWLPDRDGVPVVWLTTRTEQQRATLESADWLPNQVGVILMRAQIPHEQMRRLRILVDSEESQQRLLDEPV